jgi:hypothetical protein
MRFPKVSKGCAGLTKKLFSSILLDFVTVLCGTKRPPEEAAAASDEDNRQNKGQKKASKGQQQDDQPAHNGDEDANSNKSSVSNALQVCSANLTPRFTT